MQLYDIILFIVPGYLVLYFISLLTDYLYEKNQLDRIIQYLLFSFLCYWTSVVIILPLFLASYFLGNTTFNEFPNWIESNIENKLLTTLSILIAPFLGLFLGIKYFGKGYPHKHFSKYTSKKYTPSIYADIFLKKYKKGAWVTCHMKDETIIQGKLSEDDKDEEKRDYVISLTEVVKYFPKQKTKTTLSGERIVLNLKDTQLVEFKK